LADRVADLAARHVKLGKDGRTRLGVPERDVVRAIDRDVRVVAILTGGAERAAGLLLDQHRRDAADVDLDPVDAGFAAAAAEVTEDRA